MKIGLSSYSYARLLRASQMQWIDTAAKTAELGFEGIEFIELPGDDEAAQLESARQMREVCEGLNLPIVNYAVGGDLIHGSGGDLAAEVERLQGAVRVAAALGASYMRHDIARGFGRDHQGPRSFESVTPRLAQGCRAVAQYAADQGVHTLTENHGYFSQDSQRLERLADAVDHSHFGLLVDIGNFICVDEDPAMAVGRLMPFAQHVHIKDFHLKPGTHPSPGEGWNRSRGGNHWRGAIVGHGNVPISQCLNVIARSGYDKTLTIEYEGMEEVIDGIRISRDNLRRFLSQVV